jgi:sortase A
MKTNALRWIQRALYLGGFLILGYCGADWLNSRRSQHQGAQELDRILSYRPRNNPAIPAPRNARPQPPLVPGELIGKVEIPRLHLSAVVFQGTESTILDRGVGHLDGSPLPGQPGNVVLAAHRDTFFRSLREIRKGDTVSVTTEHGARTYQVDSTEIVDPTQTSVLDPTPKPTLTLITCYPFYYIGHAPKRFIVRARDMEMPEMLARAQPARIPPPIKETARSRPSEKEQAPSRETSQESANLTYVFKASQ